MTEHRPHPEHPLIADVELRTNRVLNSESTDETVAGTSLGDSESRSMKHRMAAILPVHFAVFCFCYATATALRFDFAVPQGFREVYWTTLPLVLLVKFAACWATAEWRRTFRYVTVLDLVFVAVGTAGAAVTLLTCNLLLPEGSVIPRSILLVDALLSLLMLTIVRFAYRTWKEEGA